MRKLRPEYIIALIGIIIALAWMPMRMRFPFDDTYITFRYVQNIAHGFGIVWNPGGAHTEGYTNFLYVLVLVPFSAMGFDLVAASQIVNVIAVIVSAIALWEITNYELRMTNENSYAGNRPIRNSQFVIRNFIPALAVAFFYLDPFTWLNAFSGMETSMFTMWLLLAVCSACFSLRQRSSMLAKAHERSCYATPFIFATLATLTRPEGALMGGILLAVGLWSRRRATTPHPTSPPAGGEEQEFKISPLPQQGERLGEGSHLE
ncbi:MAG TPA: hypothetical protein VG537_10385, partial [Candidatus Kapabacteria bacterium]|nr:hypothetical protein [Candidatus Kapabacteria bacterium]